MGDPQHPGELYAVFKPIAVRIVAVAVTVVSVLMLGGVSLALQGGPVDLALFLGLAAVIGWLMYRLAGVKAVPSPDGLLVRNFMVTTRLEWAQIVNVRFGDAPWVQLDLSDGDVISVMGIQRADGPRSASEAVRLADLVQHHGTA